MANEEEADSDTRGFGVNSQPMSWVWFFLSLSLVLLFLPPVHELMVHVWKCRRCVSEKRLNSRQLSNHYSKVNIPLWAQVSVSIVVALSVISVICFILLDLQYVYTFDRNSDIYCAALLEFSVLSYALSKMFLYVYFCYRSYETFRGTTVAYNSKVIHSFLVISVLTAIFLLVVGVSLSWNSAVSIKTHWGTAYCDFSIEEEDNSQAANALRVQCIIVFLFVVFNFVYAGTTAWMMVGKLFQFVNMSVTKRKQTIGLNSLTVNVQMLDENNEIITAHAKVQLGRAEDAAPAATVKSVTASDTIEVDDEEDDDFIHQQKSDALPKATRVVSSSETEEYSSVMGGSRTVTRMGSLHSRKETTIEDEMAEFKRATSTEEDAYGDTSNVTSEPKGFGLPSMKENHSDESTTTKRISLLKERMIRRQTSTPVGSSTAISEDNGTPTTTTMSAIRAGKKPVPSMIQSASTGVVSSSSKKKTPPSSPKPITRAKTAGSLFGGSSSSKKKPHRISIVASHYTDSTGKKVAFGDRTPIGDSNGVIAATGLPRKPSSPRLKTRIGFGTPKSNGTPKTDGTVSPVTTTPDANKYAFDVDFASVERGGSESNIQSTTEGNQVNWEAKSEDDEEESMKITKQLSVSSTVRKGNLDTSQALHKFRQATEDHNSILFLSIKILILLIVSITASLLSGFILVVFNVGGTPQIFDLVCAIYALWLSFTFADEYYAKIPCGQRLTDWCFPFVKTAALTWVCCGSSSNSNNTTMTLDEGVQCFCGCGCNNWMCGDESLRTEQFMIFVMAKDEYAMFIKENRIKSLTTKQRTRKHGSPSISSASGDSSRIPGARSHGTRKRLHSTTNTRTQTQAESHIELTVSNTHTLATVTKSDDKSGKSDDDDKLVMVMGEHSDNDGCDSVKHLSKQDDDSRPTMSAQTVSSFTPDQVRDSQSSTVVAAAVNASSDRTGSSKLILIAEEDDTHEDGIAHHSSSNSSSEEGE